MQHYNHPSEQALQANRAFGNSKANAQQNNRLPSLHDIYSLSQHAISNVWTYIHRH